jgi:hypothetical protein
MWFARLRRGTLCVETNGIKRFFAPTLLDRLYLLWLFRNFRHLPLSVLTEKNRAYVEQVCTRPGAGGDPDFEMGVVECELAAPKKASQSTPLFRPQATQIKRAAR